MRGRASPFDSPRRGCKTSYLGSGKYPFMGHFTALFPPKEIHNGKSNGQQVIP